jgi:photosystem II stability/assembly factor-like uncharacterized protein
MKGRHPAGLSVPEIGGIDIQVRRTGSSLQHSPGFCLLVALLVQATPALAQDTAGKAEFAELMPLAAESLLLDVTRIADGSLVAVGERGHVVLSNDASAWTQAESVPTRSTLTTVTQRDGLLWAAGHDSVIIHSADGGRTWALQYFDPERRQPVMDIHFTDAANGLAIGAYGLMLVTADGGVTWMDHYVSDEEWHLNALLDLGDGRLMIAGEAGLSYRSQDGGKSWEVIEMPYQGSMFGIAERGDCIMVFGLRGHAQETCDGGDSWLELDTGIEATLNAAVGDEEMLVVGNSGTLLLRGADGGFSAQYHSSGVDFAGVIELDSGVYLMVGEDGVHHWPESAAREPGP